MSYFPDGLTTDKEAKGGKYVVTGLTYPSDLFGSPEKYGNSWVMININVQQSGAWAREAGNSGLYVNLEPNEIRRNTAFDQRGDTTVAGQIAAATVGGAVGGAIGGIATSIGSIISNPARVANAAGQGTAAGAGLALLKTAPVLAAAGTTKRETKRVLYAIQLPMPQQVQTGYSMDWGEEDTALLDMMLRAPNAAAETLAKITTGSMTKSDLANMGTSAMDAAASLSLQTPGSGGLSAMSGLAANPKKEVVFQGVGFRKFDMTYKLVPRNEGESNSIRSIIQQLKYHMHPEYASSGNFTFVYPSEFDITFYTTDGNENQYVNKIATCVLENMTVDYTPDGQWVPHEEGAPNAIMLKLQFKELSILTKEMINKGF